MKNLQPEKLLQRYKNGTCTDAERLLVEKWLQDQSGYNQSLDQEVVDGYVAKNKLVIDHRLKKAHSIKLQGWLQIAALVLLFTVPVFLIRHIYKSADKRPINSVTAVPIKSTTKDGWRHITIAKGHSVSDTLTDGSIVILNGGTVIRYPVSFASNLRPVFLEEGEALFKVAKDKSRPFIVYSPGFSTTALGTEFNIRAYKNEHKTAVSLLHGKILVQDMRQPSSTKKYVLLPDHQLSAIPSKSEVLQSTFTDKTDIIGWQQKILTFKDADAPEVINKVENYFNCSIINKSPGNHWSYTGTFNHENLAEVIQTICLTENLNYKINNQIVTLY